MATLARSRKVDVYRRCGAQLALSKVHSHNSKSQRDGPMSAQRQARHRAPPWVTIHNRMDCPEGATEPLVRQSALINPNKFPAFYEIGIHRIFPCPFRQRGEAFFCEKT